MTQTISAKLRKVQGQYVVTIKAPGIAPERHSFSSRKLAEEGLRRAADLARDLVFAGKATRLTIIAIAHMTAIADRPGTRFEQRTTVQPLEVR